MTKECTILNFMTNLIKLILYLILNYTNLTMPIYSSYDELTLLLLNFDYLSSRFNLNVYLPTCNLKCTYFSQLLPRIDNALLQQQQIDNLLCNLIINCF